MIEVAFFRAYLVTIRPYTCHSWAERREIWTHGTFPPWRAITLAKKMWAVLLSNDIPTQWERSYSVVRYNIDVTFATMKSYVNCQEISWQKENICCFFHILVFKILTVRTCTFQISHWLFTLVFLYRSYF